jgi:sugar phosphate isomerase/epimerase
MQRTLRGNNAEAFDSGGSFVIGLSTYAFFWQHSDRAPQPIDLMAMLQRTRELDADVFQICDYPRILEYSEAQLSDLKSLAAELGVVLELGTKGISPNHLAAFLRLADTLGVKMIRSMVNAPDHHPSLPEAQGLLKQSLPSYEASGVRIALETYEQLSSRDLVTLIESIGSPNLGICLDPANCVAALENPIDVIDRCSQYVVNLHVKDFAFTRRGGWIGFTLEGTQLGSGLLDYDYMINVVKPEVRGINRVIEHWLTWQGTFKETSRLENLWNINNIAYMNAHKSLQS